ncbi:MAG: carbohydrate ABC transporter permease, partial [Mesorhizobium sp.]
MTGANETTRVSETAITEVGSTLSQDEVAKLMRRRGEESRWWWIVPTLYI